MTDVTPVENDDQAPEPDEPTVPDEEESDAVVPPAEDA